MSKTTKMTVVLLVVASAAAAYFVLSSRNRKIGNGATLEGTSLVANTPPLPPIPPASCREWWTTDMPVKSEPPNLGENQKEECKVLGGTNLCGRAENNNTGAHAGLGLHFHIFAA